MTSILATPFYFESIKLVIKLVSKNYIQDTVSFSYHIAKMVFLTGAFL